MYNKLSYTYVHLLVLISCLIAHCAVIDQLKAQKVGSLAEDINHANAGCGKPLKYMLPANH